MTLDSKGTYQRPLDGGQSAMKRDETIEFEQGAE
jgi:hypothetical protein